MMQAEIELAEDITCVSSWPRLDGGKKQWQIPRKE